MISWRKIKALVVAARRNPRLRWVRKLVVGF